MSDGVGPALMYGGPKDGAVFPPIMGATEMPEQILCEGGGGRYVRMDAVPTDWMSFLPQRSMATTIYLWEGGRAEPA